jgi:hypothetical protein
MRWERERRREGKRAKAIERAGNWEGDGARGGGMACRELGGGGGVRDPMETTRFLPSAILVVSIRIATSVDVVSW